MLHAIASVARAATVCAVVIPGVDGLAEFIGKSVGLNTLNDLGDLNPSTIHSIPEGFSHTIADIAIAAQHFIQSAGTLSANIGNVIGVNHLAGKDMLDFRDFTEHGGIIVKIMQRFFEYIHLIPETAVQALDENNRGVLVTGGLVALGAATAAPGVVTELHDGALSVGSRVGQFGQHAMTSAQTTGASFTQRLAHQRDSIAASVPHKA